VNEDSPETPAAEADVPGVPASAPRPDVSTQLLDSGIRADGLERRLSPAFIGFQRAAGLVFTTIVSGIALIGALLLWLSSPLPPRWLVLLVPVGWLFVTVGLGWLGYVWPLYEFRRTSYVLDEDGIEIRTGVIWRAVTNVPRSRVQHIDVSQGPLERSYGLGRLIIFTAGTHHSRVELPGLDYAVAFALRHHLLPRDADDAV
jgi:membrane protein YdbS with pleckstrin-like domain